MSGWLVRRGTFSILACALLALTLFAVAVAFGGTTRFQWNSPPRVCQLLAIMP